MIVSLEAFHVSQEHQRVKGFLLRLPVSVHDQAEELALQDGVSLNHYISQAVAERNTRLQQKKEAPAEPQRPPSLRPGFRN
jgi:hypothetical protein